MTKRVPVLTALLALLLCATARAAGPSLVVHLPEGPIEAGENFTVTVDLTGNPGILNIDFTLSFDRERMECTSIKLGELLSAQASASAVNPAGKPGAILAAASSELMEGDGTVGVFGFQAKERLTDFHFSIDRITLSNQDRKKLDVTVTGTTSAPSDSGNSTSSSGATSSGNSSGATNGGTSSGSQSDGGNSPAEPESPPFSDIAGLWAEDYIRTAAARNLFQGYPDGTFRPANRLSRAQFVMVLWNLAGRPAAPDTSPFTDMSGQIENFQKAVAWACSKGYVNGTSPTTFSPGEPLTRQAAVKILFAYHGSARGPEVMMSEVYDSLFSDSGNISAWARDAMYWAVYQKILSGTSASTLAPGGTVTRAQLAAIMVRYVERFPA